MTEIEKNKGRYRKAKGFALTGEELVKINQYTRREFTAEELFTFSVILCDNEVDRDKERFTLEALSTLAELFVGKTGIFDHEPSGKNQTARIYSCRVKSDPGRKTIVGEEYTWVEAKAYMVKNEKNEPLIGEIDAGIKKEVSIGCSVGKISCSICGKDASACSHQKGKKYGGRVCYHLLEEPADAYEWSFVAVPAQKNAGVTKSYQSSTAPVIRDVEELKKEFAKAPDELALSAAEAGLLFQKMAALESGAALGEQYKQELVKEVCRLAFLADERVDGQVMKKVAEKMDVAELKAFCTAFEERLAGKPSQPQLTRREDGTGASALVEFKM